MLFMAEMTVRIPSTLAPEVADEIKRKEKEYSQQLQRDGKWRHLWRVVGEYANVSIFDVSGNDEPARDPERAAAVPVHGDQGDAAGQPSVVHRAGVSARRSLAAPHRHP